MCRSPTKSRFTAGSQAGHKSRWSGSHDVLLTPDEQLIPTFIRGLPMAREALAYARELHRGQRRASDEAPFILHPLEVASLLYNAGYTEPVVAVGILHDTLEDTPVLPDDLEGRFGAEVAGLVAVMTEDPGIEPFEARKAALRQRVARFNGSAIAVYAADKVAKVRELRAHATRDASMLAPDGAAQARLDHYLESLAMLEDAMPDHPLVRQLRFELEALQALPPRATAQRSRGNRNVT